MTTPTTPAAVFAELVVPLPPAALSPNARVHWRTKHKAATEYARDVFMRACLRWGTANRLALAGPVELSLVFVFADRRRHDCDNLLAAFKSGLDALVGYGVLKDDDAAHLPRVTVERRVEPGCEPHVLVTLREVGDAPAAGGGGA